MRRLSKQYIKFPVTSYKVENAIEKFKTCCNSKIPQSLGAIDGTHIYIKTPKCDSKYDYFCRKQRYSINTQAVAGGDLLFLNLATGFPSSLHDSRLLIHTWLFVKANDKEILAEPKKLIENLTVCPLILGDGGYPRTSWLDRPYNWTQTLSPREKRFNKLLSSARVTVKRAFGVLKARWCCLLTLLETNLENVSDVIITCFALHNFCQINNELYQDDEILEYLIQKERSSRVHISTSSNEAFAEEGERLRTALKNFVNHNSC